MELIYCYIKSYKSLVNCELNFGGAYRFIFDSVTKKLEGKKDPDYIHSLFPENIMNITGIVGKNGTGKSAVIEFLLDHLPSGNADSTPDAIIIHLDKSNNQLIVYQGPLYADMSCEIIGKDIPVETVTSLRNEYDYGTYVYFTNSLYDRITDSNIEGLLNVSLRTLLFKTDLDQYYITDQNFIPEEIYLNFRFKEYWRILRLIQSGVDLQIDFKLPDYLILYLYRNKENYLFQKYGNLKTPYSLSVQQLLGKIQKYYADKAGKVDNKHNGFITDLERNIVFDHVAHLQARDSLPAEHLSEGFRISTNILSQLFEPDVQKMVDAFIDFTAKLLREHTVNIDESMASFRISEIKEDIFRKYIDNHYCPTKIGFKKLVTLCSQRLQVENSLFQIRE